MQIVVYPILNENTYQQNLFSLSVYFKPPLAEKKLCLSAQFLWSHQPRLLGGEYHE